MSKYLLVIFISLSISSLKAQDTNAPTKQDALDFIQKVFKDYGFADPDMYMKNWVRYGLNKIDNVSVTLEECILKCESITSSKKNYAEVHCTGTLYINLSNVRFTPRIYNYNTAWKIHTN